MLPAIPTPIPMPFAQNGERRAIPETNTLPGSADASWATGFPPVTRINKQAGGKPPYGLDFQGLFHTICEHLFFAQSGNTVPWVGAGDGQPGLNYLKGAVVQGSDGETYIAVKPSGPDTPNADGGGMVGPIDPVGDETGHWINLKLLYGGMPNSEQWLTESGIFTAPVEAWYELLLFGGGAGGMASKTYRLISGGNSGAIKRALVFLTAGQQVPVVIGAGSPGGLDIDPFQISVTSFGDVSTEGDESSFMGAVSIAQVASPTKHLGVRGSGLGGGYGWGSAVTDQAAANAYCSARGHFGGSGAAFLNLASDQYAVGDGAQGSVLVRWHDPAKAAGPLPAPALFSARSMAPRAAAAPVTVNLYDPETGQGSVWREEDAPAQLAKGMITEEAWLEICAAKAAEERAIWLTSPDTESERFELLRSARDAKLTATDYLVAPDYPLADEQRAVVTAYRQALRDLPAQEGAPWDGGGELTPWPEMPVVSKKTDSE